MLSGSQGTPSAGALQRPSQRTWEETEPDTLANALRALYTSKSYPYCCCFNGASAVRAEHGAVAAFLTGADNSPVPEGHGHVWVRAAGPCAPAHPSPVPMGTCSLWVLLRTFLIPQWEKNLSPASAQKDKASLRAPVWPDGDKHEWSQLSRRLQLVGKTDSIHPHNK